MEVQGLFGSFISIIPYNITNVNGNGANGILQGTFILNSLPEGQGVQYHMVPDEDIRKFNRFYKKQTKIALYSGGS